MVNVDDFIYIQLLKRICTVVNGKTISKYDRDGSKLKCIKTLNIVIVKSALFIFIWKRKR